MDSYNSKGLCEGGITFEKGYDFGYYTASKETQSIITQKDNTITQLLERLAEKDRQLLDETYKTTNLQYELTEVTTELHGEQTERQFLETENQTLITDLADTAFENRDQRFKIDDLELNLSKFTQVKSTWGGEQLWVFDFYTKKVFQEHTTTQFDFDIDHETQIIYISGKKGRKTHPTKSGTWYHHQFPSTLEDGTHVLDGLHSRNRKYYFDTHNFQLFNINLLYSRLF